MKAILVITVALVVATKKGGESRFVINHRPARDVENNAPADTKLNEPASGGFKGSDLASRDTALVGSYAGAQEHVADDLLKSQGGQREARGLDSFQRSKRNHNQADNDGAASAKGNDPAVRHYQGKPEASWEGTQNDDAAGSAKGSDPASRGFIGGHINWEGAQNDDAAASVKGSDLASRGAALVASYAGAQEHVADDLLKSQGGQREARELENFQRAKRSNPQTDNVGAASAKESDPASRDFVGKTVTSWEGTQNDDAAGSAKGSDPASRGFIGGHINWEGAQNDDAAASGKGSDLASRGTALVASYAGAQEHVAGDLLKSQGGQREARGLDSFQRSKRNHNQADNDGAASAKENDPAVRHYQGKPEASWEGTQNDDAAGSAKGSDPASRGFIGGHINWEGAQNDDAAASGKGSDLASRDTAIVASDAGAQEHAADENLSAGRSGRVARKLGGSSCAKCSSHDDEDGSQGRSYHEAQENGAGDSLKSNIGQRTARALANFPRAKRSSHDSDNEGVNRGFLHYASFDGSQDNEKDAKPASANKNDPASKQAVFVGDDVVEAKRGAPAKRSDNNGDGNKVANLNRNGPISRGIGYFVSWDKADKGDVRSTGDNREAREAAGFPLVKRSDSNSESNKVASLNGNDPISRGISSYFSRDGSQKDDEGQGVLNRNEPISRGNGYWISWDKADKGDVRSTGDNREAREAAGFPLVKRSDSNSESNKVASLNGNDPISRGISSYFSWDGSQKDDEGQGVLKSNNPTWRGISTFFSWDGTHKDAENVNSNSGHRAARGTAEHPAASANENDSASRGIVFANSWDGTQKDEKVDAVDVAKKL